MRQILRYAVSILTDSITNMFDVAYQKTVFHGKKEKLNFLRLQWINVPKGSLVMATEPFCMARKDLPHGNYTYTESSYIIQPGQGAMLIGVDWPDAYSKTQHNILFTFWCNDGYFQRQFIMGDFDGTLPFKVL